MKIKIFTIVLAVAGILLALYAICMGDVVYLNTGGAVKGKIVRRDEDEVVIRTPYGITTIATDDIDYIEEGGPLREMYEERLKQIKDDDADAHYKLGVWLRNVGMYEEAKREFNKVIKLDPDHQYARCELGYVRRGDRWLTEDECRVAEGYVKYKGRWVLKEDAEKLKAGYVRYRGEWVKKKELSMLKKGFRRLEGKWVSQEEYYKSKGYVKYKGRWMTPEKARKLKKREVRRKSKKNTLELIKKKLEGKVLFWDAQVYLKEDVDRAWMEQFAERVVRKVSTRLWKSTEGQAYIATAVITDKSERGNWWVQNLDGKRVNTPDGRRVWGYCDGRRIITGGGDSWTPLHELGHLLFRLPECKLRKGCIVAWSIAPKICPDCLEIVKKKYPKWKFPNKGYPPNPPGTIIKFQDR